MAKKFKVGGYVSWDSDVGRVNGEINRVRTQDIVYKEYMHHRRNHDPQHRIKGAKADHIAMHKDATLRKANG